MSTFLLFGRTLLALAIVLLLVWGLSRLAHHGQTNNARRRLSRPGGAQIEVLSKRSLSRTSSIALVSVGPKVLVVGVTSQSVALISELPITDLQPSTESTKNDSPKNDTPWMAGSGQQPTAWDAIISTLRERTVRP
jgi:flagellar biogenesis protein FliO